MKTNYIFEALTLDSSGHSTIKTSETLAYSLMSNSGLWSKPRLKDSKINDDDLKVSLVINESSQEEEGIIKHYEYKGKIIYILLQQLNQL